jgi:hypothetical protein
MGFDNAHGVAPPNARYGKQVAAHDHWHRTEGDPGRAYAFTTADQLLADFFAEVERILAERDMDQTVLGESDMTERKPR